MYLDCLVKMPNAPGKIVYQKKGETTYVYYETGRTYNPNKKYTSPKRVIIGKRCQTDPEMIQPNENFLRYFPDEVLPEEKDRSVRSLYCNPPAHEGNGDFRYPGDVFQVKRSGAFSGSCIVFDYYGKQCSTVLS